MFYCSVGLFGCNCGYSAEIYSNQEWLEIIYNYLECSTCTKRNVSMFGDMAIYRDDLDEDVPLYLQPAGLPPSAQKCLECLGVEKAHWTKLAVHCTSCGNHSMSFSEYTAGKNIEKFKEYALLALVKIL